MVKIGNKLNYMKYNMCDNFYSKNVKTFILTKKQDMVEMFIKLNNYFYKKTKHGGGVY